MMARALAAVLALTLLSAQAPAPEPGIEETPRARALMREIACMVCGGQSIADSNAPVAADMRRRVADLLEQGLTDQQIRDVMAERYGDGVLLRPPARGAGVALWAAPFVVLLAAFAVAVAVLGRRNPAPSPDVES